MAIGLASSCLLAAHPLPCRAQTLTTARDIAAHVTPKEGQPAPVSLEATVTFLDPGNTIFLRDDTGVTFVRAAKNNPRPAIGERLRITGVTHHGLIIGGIKPDRIELLERGPVPEAQPVTLEDLASGRLHYHYVSISGVGRSLRRVSENALTLRLQVGGRTLEVRFDEAPTDPVGWVDAELRVRGLAAGDINDRRELVMPYIRVRATEEVEVISQPSPEPFDTPPTPLAELQRAMGRSHRVMVRGVALGGPVAGGLFLRQAEGAVFVSTSFTGVQPGDVVEALGFPEMGVFSAHLADAECRVVGHEAAPLPVMATPGALADGRDADLISTDATVLQRLDRGDRTELMAQAGPINLTVTAPRLLPDEAQAGAVVRLTGLCRVTATRSDGYRAKPTACQLWLRGAEDAVLLQATPWWNGRRVGLAFSIIGLVAVLAVVWAALLRRQVARQLAVIEGKVQREAVTEERQRIAREFHDTLEQELAGLSLRLDAALPRVSDEKARQLLDQQRRLLGRLQTDTRDFVWDLRDPSRQDAPLDAALRSLVEHLQANTAVPLAFAPAESGSGLSVPPLVQHHLLRITREAINNALKYAQPGRIQVALEGAGEGRGPLVLSIADDGKGFDPTAAHLLDGHFGLRGMKERAEKIGAKLEIISSPGSGTRVAVAILGSLTPK